MSAVVGSILPLLEQPPPNEEDDGGKPGSAAPRVPLAVLQAFCRQARDAAASAALSGDTLAEAVADAACQQFQV